MKLIEALTRCAKIVMRKPPVPILLNVLIEPTEKGICISATDLEMFYQVEVEGVTANDTFTVPLKGLRDIVKTRKDVKEINWNPENNQITIGAVKLIGGLTKEKFPPFPYSETGINLEEFAEIRLNNLKWVMKAMSTEEIRYALCGVYVDTKEGKLVATDGHRMHMVNTDKAEAKPMIIPSAAVKFLGSVKAESVYLPVCHACNGTGKKLYRDITAEERTQIQEERDKGGPSIYLSGILEEFYNEKMEPLKEDDGKPLPWKSERLSGGVWCTDKENIVKKAYFDSLGDEGYYNEIATKPDCEACKEIASNILHISEDEVFVSRKIDGDFPDYKQVIPGKFNFQLKTTSEALKTAIAQTEGIRPERSNGIKLSLNGTCHLSTSNPEKGEVDLEFEGEFKKLLKPLDNPCEGCKDRKVSRCSVQADCKKYAKWDSGTRNMKKFPCPDCPDKQGDCTITSCGKLEAFRLSALDEFNIGLCAPYVEQALAEENVTWEFTDEFGPAVMTFDGDEAAIIMPMRV